MEEDLIEITEEQPLKKKRGRKPSKDKNGKYYFSDKEEAAVVDYNQYSKIISESTMSILKLTFDCDDEGLVLLCSGRTLFEMLNIAESMPVEDKNKLYQISELKNVIECSRLENEKIFNSILRPVFSKMIESIIRRYKLYVPNEEPVDTFNDTLSFLITKMDRYDEGKDTKAYSYYGNICKNYIIGKIQQYNKSLVRNPSYDDDDTDIDISNDNKYVSLTDPGTKVAKEIVNRLIKQFTIMTDDPYTYDLKENEVKLGKALANLLENWDYVISTDGSNKLNKNAILLFLREQTGLDTKGIRDNMKKFKNEFLIIKKYVIE
jgi:hypothetical protein